MGGKHLPTGKFLLVLLALVVALAVGACRDEPTEPRSTEDEVGQPQQESTPLTAALSSAAPVDGFMMDLPPAPRAWDEDPDALEAALTENGGGATIFFKDPGSAWVHAAEGERGFRSGVNSASIQEGLRFVEAQGARLGSYLETMGAVIATIPPEIAPRIARHPLVDFVEPARSSGGPDGVARETVEYLTSFAETTPWGIDAVNAPRAWSKTRGAGAKVLIIDIGIHRRGHADLPTIPIANCGPDGSCSPVEDHTTGVFGVLGALDNFEGVVGVAPSLAGPDIYVADGCGPQVCEDTLIARALDWGVQNDVDVVNMSISVELSSTLSAAVGDAAAASIVMISSIGNHCESCNVPTSNDPDLYPSAFTDVMGVSGVNEDLSFADPGDHPSCGGGSSNFSANVDVSAPFYAFTTSGNPLDPYETMCGTSFAAPHVSATAAMIRAIEPFLPAWRVEVRIEATAKDLGPSGFDPQFGEGFLDTWGATGPHVFDMIGPEFQVPPNSECEWRPQVWGGLDPVSFAWYDNGQLISMSQSLQLTTGNDGDELELEFIATDADNFVGEWSAFIDVTDEAEPTFFCGDDGDGGGLPG